MKKSLPEPFPVLVARFLAALTKAVVLGGLVLAAAAPPALGQEPRQWTPLVMLQGKRIGSVQVSPDRQRVAFTVRQAVLAEGKSEYRSHIHLANADGSQPFQFTQGTKSCDDPQWSPDGSWIAFLSGRSGPRNIWLIRSDGGEAQQLSHVKSGVHSFKWSPDGRWLAFTSLDPPTPAEDQARKEKNDPVVVDDNVKMNRLQVIAAEPASGGQRAARLLTPANYSVGGEGRAGRAVFDWSPDSKTIVFSHTRTPRPEDWSSADLSLVDVASGAVKPLVHTAAAEYAPLWSPDGRWIAFVASDNPPTWAGTGRVQVLGANGGSPRPLADTFDSFGRYSELVGWSADSSKLYFTEVQGTILKLSALPLHGPPIEISKTAGMTSGGLFLNGSRTALGFSWETSDQPPEVFISAVAPFAPRAVSRVNQDLASLPLGRTEVMRWQSSDGLEIEGLLTYPVGYVKGKKYPLLLVIHGGPMGVFSQTFLGAPGPYPLASFAARGYLILRPNVRGSSGYGKKFRYANYGDWGGLDYQDLMTGVDHLIARGLADPQRLGVMGWSYGGFMTSWVITQTKRFRAASVGAGVTNLMSFTGTADIPGFLPDYFGGEFWDRFEAYRAHSAMFNVKGVSTPTLIQHGERDERVPLSQGQELYNALKRQGCTVKMIVYPRTPHGVEEPKLLLDCLTRNLEWFERYVGNQQATKTP